MTFDNATILTVNGGSSSVRLSLFQCQEGNLKEVIQKHFSFSSGPPEKTLTAFAKEANILDVSIAAHRIVHGGATLVQPCFLNEEVEREILRLGNLAPLHNTAAIRWVKACRRVFFSGLPQVAVFDTAFFADLPMRARVYALPHKLRQDGQIRRYGFHGLAHEDMLCRWRKAHPYLYQGGRVISMQLGSGSSIVAISGGKPVDTSMGFTPLEGLVMATRAGDLDPGILSYLMRQYKFDGEEIERLLNEKSGLLGLSDFSGDMKALLADNRKTAKLAVNVYCYRARKYVGAYLAALGGADGILFGGGVGENAPLIRKNILTGLEGFGIALDNKANNKTVGKAGIISVPDSKVEIRVISVNEAALLAEKAFHLAGKNWPVTPGNGSKIQ